MEKRFNPNMMAKLDNPERRKALPPEKLLENLNIREGDTLLDLGAGTGYFTLPASKLCHKVYALDAEPQMLEYLGGKLIEQEVTNVVSVEGTIERIPLEDQLAEHVIASFVLHEVEPLQDGLKEMNRVLKPSGKVLCIEWEKKPMEQGPPLHHRLHSSDLSKWFQEYGFSLGELWFPTEQHYIILARKTN